MLSDQPHVDRMPDEFPATEDGFSSPLGVAGRQRVELARSAASACFGNNSRWTTLEFASNSRAIPGNVSPKSEEALEPSTFLFRNGAMEKFMRQVRLPIKLSYDEGRTWPVHRILEEGFSGYSDLAALPDGRLFCFYERGSTDGENNYRPGRLTVAMFDEEWVRARP